MFSRHIWVPLLVSGAFGLPLILYNLPRGNANWGGPVNFSDCNSAGGLAAAPDPLSPMFGAAASMPTILPGNAAGPDFSARPLEFLPVANLNEIIRFDIDRNWVTSRWDRVSTCAAGDGLHGLRVALVTGVNTWDLHGSLTYYFDTRQHLQRIAFRGWTGDASQLVGVLNREFRFKEQTTDWAGCHLAYRRSTLIGALLLQHPTVIRAANPTAQVAIVLEINNPRGSIGVSDDVRGLLAGTARSVDTR